MTESHVATLVKLIDFECWLDIAIRDRCEIHGR